MQLTGPSLSVVGRNEVSLSDLYLKQNYTDEQIVMRFFSNINLLPEKKDFYIRDFEDFYFKIRPKFSSRLIKILLEGELREGIQGLLYLISEIEESFMSACSTLQLVSKMLDFQKNICKY